MHVVLALLKLTVEVLLVLIWSWIKWLLPAGKKSLDGDVAIVTGAGSGIGRLMAIKLSQKGCVLVLWDVNAKDNEETAKMIQDGGGKAHCYTVDVSKKMKVDWAAIKVKHEVGDVSILVNNAGVNVGQNILDITEAEFTRTVSINTLAHAWTLKAFLPGMMKRNHGHVVTIASVLAYQGVPKLADYCASKSGAVGIHESVEKETIAAGATDVHFTLVNPYLISTGLFEGVRIKYEMLIPALTPDYVAERVIVAVQTNQAVLCLPRLMYILINIKTWLPVSGLFLIEKFFNVWNAMDAFTGRNKTQ